jgi:hypothetical protein
MGFTADTPDAMVADGARKDGQDRRPTASRVRGRI